MYKLSAVIVQHPLLASFAFGIASHLTVFIRGEWHMQAPVLAAALVCSCLIAFLADFSDYSPDGLCTKAIFFFNAGLFGSITTYRLFFHDLRRFSGPVALRISKLWHLSKCLNSQQYRYLHDLHQKYGSIVRTGPREVMIVRSDVFELIDSPRSQSLKPDWYDLLRPAKAVISERDPTIHNQRRKLWDKALNTTSLAQYKPLIINHINGLTEIISSAASKREPVLANDIFYWFAFDVVSELALGKAFGMQKERKWHESTIQLRAGMELLGIASPAPWLARVAFAYFPRIPVVKGWFALQDYLKQSMRDRVERGLIGKDIAEHFIQEAEKGGWRDEDWQSLYGDGMNVIIAGSETTAATMTFLFSVLAKSPDLLHRLYMELSQIDNEDTKALQDAELLNGIINETLRLYPALPSAAYRETLPQGLMVGDIYIPGNTRIIAPRYSVARLHEAFEYPEEFIPERWSSKPELVKNPRAFAPFATGRYSCVGKQLALNEIRMSTAAIVLKFIVSLAPGECGDAVIDDMKDQMAAFPGPLKLCFTPRGS